jgi:hypothetical protein
VRAGRLARTFLQIALVVGTPLAAPIAAPGEPDASAVAAAPPSAPPARAPEDLVPTGPAELLDRAFRNLYGDDFVQVMTLSTWRRAGHSISRRAQLTRKQSVRPGKALVRFLEPQEIRRTGVLILEQDARYDDFFVFLPALGKVRRLVSGQRADAFFGTDLCYEDVEPKHASNWDVRQIGTGEEAGTPCVVLDIRPKPQHESTYERMESCIEPTRAVILRTDFYRAGRVLKQLRVDVAAVRELDGRHIPFSFRIETPAQRSSTHVGTESYDIRPGLSDALFTTTNLEAGDAEGDRRIAAQEP